ncbi:MAG: CpsD/CapB family tyrosine-protein kinase [Ruminococcaceae bacterium]|nr:CpsD/CapB family tyrosine-protein kinase [Oscillospiraceae bacterium]
MFFKNKEPAYMQKYSSYNKDNETALMFSVKEAYKAIRTNIALSVMKEGCRRLVFTSAIPSEGKSTTALNVAVSFSRAYSRVLLIDCDLRKPRMHKALGLSNNVGVSNVLSGLANLDDAIQKSRFENLDVLSSGLIAPNPSEMLASERMQKMLDTLSERYEYIIIDTPPINVVADALPLIKISDGMVLVTRQNYSSHGELEAALSKLQFINAKILGVVVNCSGENVTRKYKSMGKYMDKINTEPEPLGKKAEKKVE